MDTGEYYESERRITGADEYQITRLGNQRIYQPDGLGIGNVRRTPCSIFDVSQVHNAVSARLEFYIFASSAASTGHGAYNSKDPEEVVELRALDRFTPEQIMDAPFGDTNNHDLDPLIAQDLTDGELYATKTFTASLLDLEHLSPSPTATPRHSNCADVISRACGRWVSFELTQKAVDDLNAAKGLWGLGWSLATIDLANSQQDSAKEWLFFGAHMDTSKTKTGIYPSYLRPKPRLVVEFAPKTVSTPKAKSDDPHAAPSSSKTLVPHPIAP